MFAAKVPSSPIYDIKQALDNPWVANSDRIQHIPVAGAPDLHLLASPVRYAGRPDNGPAPALGADTDALLAEAGIGPDEAARLRAAGVI